VGTPRVASVAVVVLLALAGCGSGDRGAQAGCAGPDVRLTPTTVAPGDDVRVRARFVWAECYDTGQTGTPPPERDVSVTFRTGDRTVSLATLDAEPDGRIDTTVRIPYGAAPGTAQIAVDFATAEVIVEPHG
jgi:hypothetical protein